MSYQWRQDETVKKLLEAIRGQGDCKVPGKRVSSKYDQVDSLEQECKVESLAKEVDHKDTNKPKDESCE